MLSSPTAARPRSPTTALGAFYFFNYGGLGALFPFLPLLLTSRGLSPEQISWVMVLVPSFNLLMPPLWGALADALQARLLLLRLAAFACAASLLTLIPAWGFLGNLLSLALLSMFRAPIGSLVDAATYAALGGRDVGYGHIRVWGSIGFAVFALALGQLGGSQHPTLLVGAAALIYFASGLCTLALPPSTIRRQPGVVRDALRWAAQPAVLLFLAGNVAYYLAHAVYDGYFSLQMSRLGFDDSVISRAWAIGVVAEIVVMVALPPLISRSSGAALLAFSAAVSGLRWHLLARWRRRGPLLALQSLHGITFGLWYLALVQHVQARAPERLRTTLQAAAAATIGLGAVAGYLLAGRAFEAGGGAAAFSIAVRGSLVGLLCYALMPLLASKKAQPPDHL